MSKIRIYELAKQLGVANKDLVAKINSIGIEAKSHMAMLTEEEAAKVTALYQPKKEEPKKDAPKTDAPKQNQPKQNQPKQDGQKKENDRRQDGNRPAQKKDNRNEGRSNENRNESKQGKGNNNNNNNNNKQGGQNNKGAQQQGKKDNNKGKDKKDKKGNKNGQKVRENPMERRRREMEEEAALMAELAALEAEEANADPVIKYIPESITVKDLAEVLGKKGSDLVMNLMKKGKMLAINATLDFDTAASIAEEYNVILEQEEEKDIMEEAFGAEEEEDESKLEERPPVVVVMGHVDHGKTSLLDAIRHSSVTKGEAGGITQHIGAYTVQIDGKPITFLDTPGHEAFTAMRMRGAQITDIAILVVAADDGIMPQTVEAINHAKAAGVEIIVAINKMDKEGANPDKVMQQLTEHELVPEEWGGDVICVPVSAKTKMGIDKLLETILLVSEMAELKANPDRQAKGVVIEAKLDKGRGPIATLLVQNGTLNAGDIVVAGTAVGKIRAMSDYHGKPIETAGPSVPVEIMGLDSAPMSGDEFNAVSDEKLARALVEQRKAKAKEEEFKLFQKVTLDTLFDTISEGEMKELNIIVKADVQGSVEAVKQSLLKIENDEVNVKIVHGAVGAVSESDVMLAEASKAIIVAFNTGVDQIAADNAKRDGVEIKQYDIIYDAIEDIERAMRGMRAPKYRDVDTGEVEVREVYKISSAGTIAGSLVTSGTIKRDGKVRVIRNGKQIADVKLANIKRFKDEVKEVSSGYECGISLDGWDDIQSGDILQAYIVEEYRD